MEGKRPKSDHAVRFAVARVGIARGAVTNNYENCGRRYGEDGGKYMITPQEVLQEIGGLEEQEVLHMQVHQEGVEIGGHTQDHSQGFEQEWLQVVPGVQEEPSHCQADAAKKGVGEAIHKQEPNLVDPEHAPDL